MKDFPTPADASGLSNSVEFMESDKKKKRTPLGAGMPGCQMAGPILHTFN